jgi:uroporphyrinogen decarboxylase
MTTTSRERVIRCLRFENPDRAPRDLWCLPGTLKERKDEVEAVKQRFPVDFGGPRVRYGQAKRATGTVAEVGTYVDAWGSEWRVGEPGVIGEVKQPALADWAELAHYQPPWEVLDEADFSEVNRSCAETDLFVRAGTGVRPFEQMQFLRGSENLFLDIGYDRKELYLLRDMVHEYSLREMAMWAKTNVDGVSFMDDWGTQHTLLISLDLWRSLYKPLYRDYVDIIHAGGKFAFFHSDGQIMDIYPELIEIGVDAVNSQLFCMDIERLGEDYRGRITFWGEIDRQWLLPFGDPEEVKEGVRRVRRALDRGDGGLIAQFEWGLDVPRENVEAAFEAWEEPRS